MPLLEIIGMTPTNHNFVIAYALMKDETESSYTWAMEQFKLLIGNDVHPTCFVTDRELALVNAIRNIFPGIANLLCTWHINKDVEAMVYKLVNKNKRWATTFRNSRWKMIVEAPTLEKLEHEIGRTRFVLNNLPQGRAIMDYLEQTWLVHKEKFVRFWTNDVLHFGNTTTCRVESAHNQMKQWLNASTGAMDTVWEKIDKELDHQMTNIRYL